MLAVTVTNNGPVGNLVSSKGQIDIHDFSRQEIIDGNRISTLHRICFNVFNPLQFQIKQQIDSH